MRARQRMRQSSVPERRAMYHASPPQTSTRTNSPLPARRTTETPKTKENEKEGKTE